MAKPNPPSESSEKSENNVAVPEEGKIEEKTSVSSSIREAEIKTNTRISTTLLLVDGNLDKQNEKYSFHSLSPEEEKSPEFYKAMTNFFIEIFSNSPYNQFIFHEDDPLSPIPPQEAFGEPDKDYFSLEELNRYSLKEGEHFWIDPAKTLDILTKKLADSHMTLLFNQKKDRIEGVISGKRTTVGDIFETEEIENPLLYADYEDPSLLTNKEAFCKKTEYHFGLEEDDDMFYISNMSLHPDARGGKYFEKMMTNFFKSLSQEELDLYVFSETSGEGTSYTILKAVMERVIYGVLENGHPVCAGKLRDSAEHFTSGNYRRQVLKHLRQEKTIKEKGYLPSEKDNKNVVMRDIEEKGSGVFSIDSIQEGEVIAVFEGETYWAEKESSLPKEMKDHAVQVEEREYLHDPHSLAELINHNCDPNCGINIEEGEDGRLQVTVIAMKDIPKDTELGWDYRMTEDSDWVMEGECLCGSERCTGKVGPFRDLPEEIKQEYISAGVVSKWILAKHGLDH